MYYTTDSSIVEESSWACGAHLEIACEFRSILRGVSYTTSISCHLHRPNISMEN